MFQVQVFQAGGLDVDSPFHEQAVEDERGVFAISVSDSQIAQRRSFVHQA